MTPRKTTEMLIDARERRAQVSTVNEIAEIVWHRFGGHLLPETQGRLMRERLAKCALDTFRQRDWVTVVRGGVHLRLPRRAASGPQSTEASELLDRQAVASDNAARRERVIGATLTALSTFAGDDVTVADPAAWTAVNEQLEQAGLRGLS